MSAKARWPQNDIRPLATPPYPASISSARQFYRLRFMGPARRNVRHLDQLHVGLWSQFFAPSGAGGAYFAGAVEAVDCWFGSVVEASDDPLIVCTVFAEPD